MLQRVMSCAISHPDPVPARADPRPLPRELREFRDFHAGETIVVCGCGSSLSQLVSPERFVTIGVNDVGRLFQPDYLVVLNPRQQFRGDRFRFVEESRARAIFSQLNLGIRHPHIVPIRLGQPGGVDFSDPNVLHYTRNSPYLALCLAIHMGAKRIGLIGVDFTEDHFFARTGQHPLTRQLPQIDQEYKRLQEACLRRGVEIFNLSACSRLTAFSKLSLEQFAACTPARESLNIVSYATTPVAGTPAILARCIAARTAHRCRALWPSNSYGNGVSFEGDVEWRQAPSVARELLESADVVIVHNGKIDPSHQSLIKDKPVVTMAHNYMWNVDEQFVRRGFPGVVVGQYQATLPEFKNWHVVPNPVPLWEERFQPGPKELPITICYTPSGKHETYPASHRLYWHSKGYATTTRILETLARRYPLRLELIRNRQVSHAEALAMKQRAHIVIDECVTGSYHRNSLEGLAAGCVVVNAVGRMPGVADAFRYCAGGAPDIPFVCAGLDDLEKVLAGLIEEGAEALIARGAGNRLWMEKNWEFVRQWKCYWEPVVAQALEHANGKAPIVCISNGLQPGGDKVMSYQTVMKESKQGLSVVVCHGGQERLVQLRASLANLRQCPAASEIIVVDMGRSPYAEEVARRWADKYVFIRNDDVFERARCLNVGTALAECDLVLWKDNDLIVPPGFIEKSVAEMRARRLDYLVPYSLINYLSAPDSQEIIRGTRGPGDCKPVNVVRSRYDVSGGAGLVRRSFVFSYGGIPEDFRGWGGEDNAWMCKAHLLGRIGVTEARDQVLYHLFHPNSGGYGGRGDVANNPYYAKNVARLGEMRSIRDPRIFVRRFPPPARLSLAPEDKRVLVLTEPSPAAAEYSSQVVEALAALSGVKVDSHVVSPGDSAGQEFVFILGQPRDAVVIFGTALALSFLSSESLAALWPKTIVVPGGAQELDAQATHRLNAAGAVCCADPAAASTLKQARLRPWTRATATGETTTPLGTALTLLQPLSIILGGTTPVTSLQKTTPGREAPAHPANVRSHVRLPVWMYWEGECPEWIRQCQQTVFAHAEAEDVRLLSPADFDKLRDKDRDIDLGRLQVAHRADYIRAFLLARYGGLWIDSDCLVMKSLQPVLDALSDYDFVAHRERSGYVSNGFIAARPGSVIAAEFYRRICETLRSRRPLGWISLGGEPLTQTLKTTASPWHEIECEFVQPICWSNPEAFFATAAPAEHERVFNPRAICYMLSNTTIRRFQTAHPSQSLLDDGTFFRYLLGKALEKNDDAGAPGEVRTAMPHCQQLPFCIESIVDLAPQRVLDVGVGLGRWGMLIREFCEESDGRAHREHWKVHLEGIQPCEQSIEEHHRFFYDAVQPTNGCGIAERMNGSWDLVIVGDLLERVSQEAGGEILRRALDIGDYALVNHPIVPEADRCPRNGNARWRLSDFLALEPVRLAVSRERHGPDYGSFLLSRHDPKRMRSPRPMEGVFSRILENYLPVGDESISGPGSCLVHTVEIRERLPVLIEDIGARALLDAPCGDFNWMKHVALGIEQYIGADVIPQVVAQNQKKYGRPDRKFMTLDVTRDRLPQVDVVLCRDCLVHFSYEDVLRALGNFKDSKSTYLLTTTFPKLQANKDIATGGWRPLNLQLYPFHFPEPFRIINEKCTENGGKYADKSLGLWRLEDIL